jgi:sulfatase maturation enzyme AslB (radical SAM superfamily)
MRPGPIKKKLRFYQRRVRQARMVARAIQSRHHPILAHIIPMRRCNLSCAYCNEYDKVSAPVATEEMLRRIDMLARLGTQIITISGGEPLLHPELDVLIRAIRSHDAIATIITNGYLLTPERIERLNRAGLEQLRMMFQRRASRFWIESWSGSKRMRNSTSTSIRYWVEG